MPVTLDYSIRSYGGGAAPTTITQTITSATLSIPLADTTTWLEVNTGSKLTTSGYIVIAIDYGLSTEEKVLCASGGLTGNGTGQTITALLRGYDGTTAQSHSSGATVAVVASSAEIAEANKAAASTKFLNTTPSLDPNPPGLITLGSTTNSTFNGSATTAASSNHSHPLPTSAVQSVITQAYLGGFNGVAKNTASSADVTFPTATPTGIAANTATTTSITGVTKVMWVAHFQWGGAAATTASMEVNLCLFYSTGGAYTLADTVSAAAMPSGATFATLVGTGVVTGLTATNSYTFGLNGAVIGGTSTATDRSHFNRFSLSVVGIA